MDLRINDVRTQMPNYPNYKDWQRGGDILGIAVHHSATADRMTGAPLGNAQSFFDYHVNTRGWSHGGYNYVITGASEIEYALDEKIAAYHAGFQDPDDSEGLEQGQYWNNHYLAICLAGWFSENRTYRDDNGRVQPIPNQHTSPSQAQMESLIALLQHLRQKYNIPVENVRGHRELPGNSTICPGHNFDPAELRQKLLAMEQPQPEPTQPGTQPEVKPGEHVILLPDTDKYLDAAMAYIWKFQPDISFSINEARGRWKYMTVVGTEALVSESQLDRLRSGGATLVQRIGGEPKAAQATLDQLVEANLRFLTTPEPPPAGPRTYTVQPGDTLSSIAKHFYGASSLWQIIFEANRNILSEPSKIRPGQTLVIPPKPE
jgi:LysM repeat protein